MNGWTKCLLVIGIMGIGLGLYISYTSAPLNPTWTLAFPLGVISLGLAFIFHVLREPTAQFNAEQQAQFHPENSDRDTESHPHPEITTRHAH